MRLFNVVDIGGVNSKMRLFNRVDIAGINGKMRLFHRELILLASAGR
jgi:hypothetical protein